eukprot:gnl/TRDRNA2_/TRDRNA2_179004_c0_seq1.p1 gnl/TRDRNA2_/TRDRNA2_179004_c0~~gnl/TRDRNA2_/TRDRNA2_179004_c0_seq1.p1  ORF type:complete len:247 (+),score=55.55 gnl/TRDRNA2_/TRDRNA2_179004_c0_seq1:79-741(+)
MAYAAPDVGMIQVVVGGESVDVHSAILTLASPVFKEMLSGGTKEATENKIELPGKSKTEFEAFLSFLLPGAARTAKITDENVDYLLEWFDTYRVDTLKDECENFLLSLPPDMDRLVQSKHFTLPTQYKRCLEAIGRDFEKYEIEKLVKTDPDIFMDLIPVMKEAKKTQIAKGVAAMDIPNKLYGALSSDQVKCGNPPKSQRVDVYVRDKATDMLKDIFKP